MYKNYAIVGNYNNRLPKFTNVDKTINTGLAKFVGYYRLKKGIKQKYMRIVTGLKYDLELNIHDHDIDSDNIRLFFLEKPSEFHKRWESKDSTTVLKYLPENQIVNYGNFNQFCELVDEDSSFSKKKKFNHYIQFIYSFYLRSLISFKYRLLDGVYGNFNPIFEKINVLPTWSKFLKKYEIKNWAASQFYSQKFPLNVLNCEFNKFSTQPRIFPILFKFSRQNLILQKYKNILFFLPRFKNFFNLFRLPIYLNWRHDRFFARKKRIISSSNKPARQLFAMLAKKKMALKSPNFSLPYTFYDTANNRYVRLASSHHLAAMNFSFEKNYNLRSQLYTFEPIVFMDKNNFKYFTPFFNFKNYFKFFVGRVDNFKKFKFYFNLQKNFIRNNLDIRAGQRYKSGFFTPYLQYLTVDSLFKKRHKYRKKKFPPFHNKFLLKKKSSEQLPKKFTMNKLNFLPNLSKKVSAFLVKSLKKIFRLILAINVLHVHLASLSSSNKVAYIKLVNNIISGLNNRFNFIQRFAGSFTNFYFFYQLRINFKNRLNNLLKFIKPGYSFASLLAKNYLTYRNMNEKFSLFKKISSLVSLFPNLISPLLAKFAGRPAIVRDNYATLSNNNYVYLFNSDFLVYRNLINFNGIRYYYADQLNHLYFKSAFPKFNFLSFSRVISKSFAAPLPIAAVYNSLIKKGLQVFRYKSNLINYLIYKSRFFRLRPKKFLKLKKGVKYLKLRKNRIKFFGFGIKKPKQKLVFR
jgi:hypothetical protein